MVNEIAKNGYHRIGEVWTNYNKQYEKYNGLNYFEPSKGWSSGPTALHLASEHRNNTIYILGFDYRGIGADNKRAPIIFLAATQIIKEKTIMQLILAIGCVKQLMLSRKIQKKDI